MIQSKTQSLLCRSVSKFKKRLGIDFFRMLNNKNIVLTMSNHHRAVLFPNLMVVGRCFSNKLDKTGDLKFSEFYNSPVFKKSSKKHLIIIGWVEI